MNAILCILQFGGKNPDMKTSRAPKNHRAISAGLYDRLDSAQVIDMNETSPSFQAVPVLEEEKLHRPRTSAAIKGGHNGAPVVSELVTADGSTWVEYRKTLVPDYVRAWRDLLFCYGMLFGGFAMHVAANSLRGNRIGFAAAPIAVVWVGFWLHALNQFAHEGAHGHLARDRRYNDLLTDWLLWPLFAQSIRSYRKSHMQHHVHLGDHLDTEISYYNCMNPWYFVKFITGIQLVTLIVRYVVKSDGGTPAASGTTRANISGASNSEKAIALLRTVVLHGALVAVPARFGLFGSSVVWLLGVVVMYPFFNSSRQLLEHRTYNASCETDFTKVEHGPVNRHFGNDLFSRYFGAAGVNKHLFHHWDPTISYTRFADMEAFMLRTPHASKVEEGRTTYVRATRTVLATSLRH